MHHGLRRMMAFATCLLVLVTTIGTHAPQALANGLITHHSTSSLGQIPDPSGGDGRFIPDIHAPTLPTGVWHPSHPSKTATLNTVQARAGSRKTATSSRQPGEQVDLRTAATSTFLNADGTWTVKSYAAPVHYQDANGKWQNIDDTLVSDTSDSGYAYGNTANAWHVHFAAQSGGNALVHVQLPNTAYTETLNGAAAVTATTTGRRIIYPGVFSGVDLAYTVASASVEEALLLRSGQVPSTYSFTYHLPGASAHQDANGNIVFTDTATQHVLFEIGGVLMYEADAQEHMQSKAAQISGVPLSLTTNQSDFTITMTPDQTWLHDATRHFPVVIDPTVTWVAADPHTNTTNGNIYADTFVSAGLSGTNYVTNNLLEIGNNGPKCNVCSPTPPYSLERSYLKFPVATSIPAQVRVTSADLALWQSTANSGGGIQITANAVQSAWNATTLTWTNQPTSFLYAGKGTTSATANTWVHLDVSTGAYAWWQAGLTLNGLELQYGDESQKSEFFFSDDNSDSAHLPTLTITYVQDQTGPGGGLALNGGAAYTNSTAVTLAPSPSDTGAVSEWSSNWTTVNGVGDNGGHNAIWNVDTAGSQLTADTSNCGATACWAQTFFTHTVNLNNWPTFTAMIKTDTVNNFQFGVVSGGNNSNRFILAGTSSNALGTLQASTVAGAWNSYTVNIPFTANTWYNVQVDYPLSTVGEFYIWAAGQPRPTTPTLYWTGLYMTNPGLTFWLYGDNGANLHHYYIANVNMTSKNTGSGTIGYGVYGMEFANDGATWSCPSGGTWCVAAQRQTNWSLSTGDGRKTVSVRYADNAGNVSTSGSAQIILDRTAPTVSVTAPGSGHEVRGIVTVSASATDPAAPDGTSSGVASAALFLDGVQVGTPVTTAGTPTFLWDTTNVAPGRHVLTVQATDTVGNTGTSAGSAIDVSNAGQMPYETFAMRDLPAGGISAGANVANGNTAITQQDLDIPGRGPDLSIGRTYNALAPINNLFGWGWTSDLDEGMQTNADGSVTYRDPAGGFHVFLPDGHGGFLTSPGLFLTLTKNGDGSYSLTSLDQSKTNFNLVGYLTSIVDRNGNTLGVAYDASNLPTTVTDSSGRQLVITTSGGHITRITTPDSRTYNYAYDASGNLTDYTNPSGVVTHYDYDANHRLTKITLNYQSGGGVDQQTNVATTLTYDSSNRLVQLVDPLGYDAVLQYGSAGSWQTMVAQLQTPPKASPPSCGTTYECTTYTALSDGSGALAQIQDPLGHTTQYQYNSNDLVTQVTSPAGRVSTSTYDGNGNTLTHVVDPGSGHLALTTSWTYDSANNVLTSTDPRGIVTQYTYDAPTTGDLVKVVRDYDSSGTKGSDINVTTTSTYDSYGEVLTSTDPLGVVTQYTYDSYGDTLTTTQNYKSGVPADSQTNVQTSATYDVLGQKLTATDALGIVSTTTYDSMGNVTQSVANYVNGGPSDSQTNITTHAGYDALDRQVTATNPNGVVTQTTFDADGRTVKTIQNYVNGGPTDSQTNVATTTTYDAAGNATVATDAKGNTTTTTYDLDNRATEVVVKSSAGTVVQDTKTSYDTDGNKLSSQVIDNVNNPATAYTYDAAERLATQSDPPASPGASDQSGQSNVTTNTYDADGNVTKAEVTNAALSSPVGDTLAAFDRLNHQTFKNENANTPDAQTTNYGYDWDGRQVQVTDLKGRNTYTTYDALGRVIAITHPDSTQDTSTYDADGRRLTQVNSADTTIDAYDALSRVANEQHKDGTGTLQSTVTYTYDGNGNKLQQITTYIGSPSTTTVWTYDKLDRTATMNDGTRSYSYDANGNVLQMQVYNGGSATVAVTSGYDGGNRLTSQTDAVGSSGTTLHSYSYTYDGTGNRSAITEDGTTTNYSYDGDKQLTQIKDSTGANVLATYTYDANHNRTSLVTSAGTTTYTYDSGDVLLTSKADPNGKVTQYTYDPYGNLATATYDPTGANQVTSYTYDTNNRLTEVDNPTGSKVTFTYDANGNRTSKAYTTSGPTPTTTVVTDVYQQGHIAYQTDGSGTVLATFTYDPNGVPESVTVGSDPTTAPRYYYVYNGHGDVVALTDATGTTVAAYAYDVFGTLTSTLETFANSWSNPYRYDGKDGVRYDAETGLYWMSVRAYDPTLGRFLSRDPLGRAPLFFVDQPYVYTGNNPLTNVDPSGQRMVSSDRGGFYWFDDPPHADGWVHFVHGTVPQLTGWDGVQIDSDIGGGDFGVGYYTFVNDKRGREAAKSWAIKKIKSLNDRFLAKYHKKVLSPAWPEWFFYKMRWQDYEQLKILYVTPWDLNAAYQRYAYKNRTGYDLVIGPVGTNENGERVANWGLPLQYKFEGAAVNRLVFERGEPCFM